MIDTFQTISISYELSKPLVRILERAVEAPEALNFINDLMPILMFLDKKSVRISVDHNDIEVLHVAINSAIEFR